MPSEILLTDDSAFGHAYREMGSIVSQFTTDMTTVAQDSASPAAAGMMPEGINFMKLEREGRELLVQYMTKTSDGLTGYQNVAEALGHEHHRMVALNTQRLKTILQPSDGAVPSSPIFDWRAAVAHQLEKQNGGV